MAAQAPGQSLHSGAKCTQQVFNDKRKKAGVVEEQQRRGDNWKGAIRKGLIKVCMNIKYNNLHMQSFSIF